MNGKPRKLRLLAIASIIGLGSALGVAAAPAGAATAQHAVLYTHQERVATSLDPIYDATLNENSGFP